MKRIFTILLLTSFLIAGVCLPAQGGLFMKNSKITAVKLRTEYHTNPLGIDITKPRLSWIIESGAKGQVQTAYRILVSSSQKNLDKQKADIWDSGKVNSDKTNQIEYKGIPLKSRMQCFWKVMVWDKNGKASKWSEPTFWTMGLLDKSDWQGKWIGYDAPNPYEPKDKLKPLSLEDCMWLWHPSIGNSTSPAPGHIYFRKTIDVKGKLKSARSCIAVDNEARFFVNSQMIDGISMGKRQETDLVKALKQGQNIIAINAINHGDSPNPASIIGKFELIYEDGTAETFKLDESLKVDNVWREGTEWTKPDFDTSKWKNLKPTAKWGEGPFGKPTAGQLILPPPPYLRKEFKLEKPIRQAFLYSSALGIFETNINGKRVGNEFYKPGWTDYPTRVYYFTHDVTDMLKKGDNAIGTLLGDGWYAGHIGFGFNREQYGKNPRYICQLEVTYTDGTSEKIVSNGSWKANYGPTIEADWMMGETYDANKELTDWDKPGFKDCKWDKVATQDKIDTKYFQAYPGVPVRLTEEIPAKTINEPTKGAYVFDLGQNFAGLARLKIKGKKGQKVTMKFVEVLKPDGNIYTDNLRAARCTDTYICKGKGTEIWQPMFTSHGFRYVEVTGLDSKPDLDMITGLAIYSNTAVTGSFECSVPMVNQLYSNIGWSQRSNFIDIPTDCPQRDERLGWTGDAQIFVRTATYNMDTSEFFTKWLVDLDDAQGAEGDFPDVAPRKCAMGGGTAAWGDAGVICPWTVHHVYGDDRLVIRHYESMKKWIAYCEKNSKNLLRPDKGYGDWVSIASNTPKDIIGTAYFAYSTKLLSKMAYNVGFLEDGEKYEKLFYKIKKAFNDAYVKEDGTIKGNTQTCYAMALAFDLLSDQDRVKAGRHLYERVKAKNWHLSTGFVGLSYLLPTLTDTGNLDIAYKLLLNDTFPSWGYSIKNGATSIWERWDGWTEEKGFQTPGMNSFNHYSFGAVGRWMMGTVAGIDTIGNGFKKIIIKPQPGSDLTYAKASYDSINGLIKSGWKIKNGKFKLDITIPANTTAMVYVPTAKIEKEADIEKMYSNKEFVKFVRTEAGFAVFEVGSGKYRFQSEI